ncbi:16S rRNA (guanine(527)-N(7))-methyltransferase RsmG [Halothiobacillus sp. DCM-1]|uniref:16S rRNA (guanine(527)-N(7))-methyltransferase RsmG n=1 Tax=Halothiobacillus sp. DCM-1 TaxID=3112558 RepID=UPI003246D09A
MAAGDGVIDSAAELAVVADRMGVAIDLAVAERIEDYLALLHKWNQTYNLTAVRNLPEMRLRHALDALAVLPWIEPDVPLADVGSGPGIPGIILALARPTLPVTLIDSNLKMTRFAQAAVQALALDQVTVQRARVEALPPGQYGQIISRAFAATGDFLRWTEALGTPSARWLAMKGRLDPAEQAAVPPVFALQQVQPLAIPGLDAARHLLIYQRAR